MEKETDDKYEIMLQVMEKLEGILCSYQGRNHQSVYVDKDSLALFVSLLVYGQIKMKDYRYDYDTDIYNDKEAVGIYRNLAPQTRWRIGRHTQIEPIRMNALKQFVKMGTPVYKEYIYYADTGAVLECGEILPYEIFRLFSEAPEVRTLYIFPYPYSIEGENPVYYSFSPTESGRNEMKKYVERKQEEMYRIVNEISKKINVIPEIPPLP